MAIFIVTLAIIHACAASRHALCASGLTPCTSDVPCPSIPGGNCEEGSTCCPAGCCPLPNAVCCSDQEHCCPSGTVCDIKSQICIGSGGESYNMFKKNQKPYSDAVPNVSDVETFVGTKLSSNIGYKDTPCPGDPSGKCSGDAKCCSDGCCPFSDGVCCPGLFVCCPSGMTCNQEYGFCTTPSGQAFSFTEKKRNEVSSSNVPTNVVLKDTPCPGDPSGKCSGDAKCCSNGCCPFPDGECCPWLFACCPTGMTCNQEYGYCTPPSGQVFSFSEKKSNAISSVWKSGVIQEALPVRAEVVYCPGGQYYCPDLNTCCILPNGSWGCCPLPSATCCPDKLHCCPSGYRCDSTSQYCIYGNFILSSRKKIAAFSLTKS